MHLARRLGRLLHLCQGARQPPIGAGEHMRAVHKHGAIGGKICRFEACRLDGIAEGVGRPPRKAVAHNRYPAQHRVEGLDHAVVSLCVDLQELAPSAHDDPQKGAACRLCGQHPCRHVGDDAARIGRGVGRERGSGYRDARAQRISAGGKRAEGGNGSLRCRDNAYATVAPGRLRVVARACHARKRALDAALHPLPQLLQLAAELGVLLLRVAVGLCRLHELLVVVLEAVADGRGGAGHAS